MDVHLEQTGSTGNRKKGSTPKTVKSAAGAFTLNTPRDRESSFEPQLVKKQQTLLTDEMERKF
ncbi:MAG: transposase [Gammaproteobacteria bacterium]|nr:transposase [Gammaproteobacteria bacterium]